MSTFKLTQAVTQCNPTLSTVSGHIVDIQVVRACITKEKSVPGFLRVCLQVTAGLSGSVFEGAIEAEIASATAIISAMDVFPPMSS